MSRRKRSPRSPRLRSARPTWDTLEARVVMSSHPNAGIDHSPIIFKPAPLLVRTGAASPIRAPPARWDTLQTNSATAYGIKNVLFGSITGDGSGQTIAIIDAYDNPAFVNSTAANFASSDLALYDATYGIPNPPSFTKFNQLGQTTNLPGVDPAGAGSNNWEGEEALDIELAHALAPRASIDFVEANTATNDLFTAVALAATLPGVSAISMSWGGPRSERRADYRQHVCDTQRPSGSDVPGLHRRLGRSRRLSSLLTQRGCGWWHDFEP